MYYSKLLLISALAINSISYAGVGDICELNKDCDQGLACLRIAERHVRSPYNSGNHRLLQDVSDKGKCIAGEKIITLKYGTQISLFKTGLTWAVHNNKPSYPYYSMYGQDGAHNIYGKTGALSGHLEPITNPITGFRLQKFDPISNLLREGVKSPIDFYLNNSDNSKANNLIDGLNINLLKLDNQLPPKESNESTQKLYFDLVKTYGYNKEDFLWTKYWEEHLISEGIESWPNVPNNYLYGYNANPFLDDYPQYYSKYTMAHMMHPFNMNCQLVYGRQCELSESPMGFNMDSYGRMFLVQIKESEGCAGSYPFDGCMIKHPILITKYGDLPNYKKVDSPPLAGQTCEPDSIDIKLKCPTPMICDNSNNGSFSCKYIISLGGECNNSTLLCNANLGLSCDASTSKCIKTVDKGLVCNNDLSVFCKQDLICDTGNYNVCISQAKKGESCDDNDNIICKSPYECIDGVCKQTVCTEGNCDELDVCNANDNTCPCSMSSNNICDRGFECVGPIGSEQCQLQSRCVTE